MLTVEILWNLRVREKMERENNNQQINCYNLINFIIFLVKKKKKKNLSNVIQKFNPSGKNGLVHLVTISWLESCDQLSSCIRDRFDTLAHNQRSTRGANRVGKRRPHNSHGRFYRSHDLVVPDIPVLQLLCCLNERRYRTITI